MRTNVLLLGPLVLHRAGQPVTIGPAKRQLLATALALHPNQPVSLTNLSQALWTNRPPPSAVANLRTHAAVLRRLMGGQLLARPHAYELVLADGELDADTFTQLAAAGRILLHGGHPAGAEAKLAAALNLWRTDTAAEGLSRANILGARLASLDEQRRDVFEDWVQASLDSGQPVELTARLRHHLDQHPLRERAWRQLMLVLYRSGNVAGALAIYREVTDLLRQQLGLEPGRDLVHLHRAILNREPTLDGPGGTIQVATSPPTAPQTGPVVGDHGLPVDVGPLVGRDREITTMVDALRTADPNARSTVLVVSGRSGTGKTSLAVHVAHLVADQYPDGQISMDLGGKLPRPPQPEQVVDRLLRTLDVAVPEAATRDERAGLLRSLLATRRILILLDDAASAAQIRPLVPAQPGSAVIVVTRRPIATPEAADLIELGPLTDHDGLALLELHLGRERVAAEPERAAELVTSCAGLPLAIRIVAARLARRPDWPLGAFVEHLAENRFDGLEFDDLSVRDSIAADHRVVTWHDSVGARVFRTLGRSPTGSVDVKDAAVRLCEPRKTVVRALERLVDAGLAETPIPGHYRLPDLVRQYAAELAQDDHRPQIGFSVAS